MAWHDREPVETVRQVVAQARRNAVAHSTAVSDNGTPVSRERRSWVQPPLPLVDDLLAVDDKSRLPLLPSVSLKSIRITPDPGGGYKVVVKADHSTRGAVYRYGIELDVESALELVLRFLGGDYWTPDKYG